MPLVLQLTDAGLAAIQGATGSDPTVVAELGLTNTPFDFAPTLTALPGEFKRLPITSGVAAAANVAHLTVYDTSGDIWSATGFALFLDDGTLLAAYTQPDPVLTKAELAFALLAFDIRFASDLAANIEYGDNIFIWPPATEDTRGIAKIAPQARVDAEEDEPGDDDSIVTPRTLRQRLSALLASIMSAIGDATAAITVERDARIAADNAITADVAAEAATRLSNDESIVAALTALRAIGSFGAKGHLDIPIISLGSAFRINWGKTDVAAKTATIDTYDAPFGVCHGVFQGGGTPDVNSTGVLRAYPGTGAEAITTVNLTNGTDGLLTIHWIAIGMV